jgi:apolipoprotein N-acyltransferase
MLGLILFCLVGQQLQFFIFSTVLKFLKIKIFVSKEANDSAAIDRITGSSLLLLTWIGLLYVGINWAVPKVVINTLGNTLFRLKFLKQVADLGGPELLTFLILATNIGFYQVFQSLRALRKHSKSFQSRSYLNIKFLRPLVFPLGLLLAAQIYGWKKQDQILKVIAASKTGIQLAAIQGSISDTEKLEAENKLANAAIIDLNTYRGLSERALNLAPKPEALIWPETAFPGHFRTPISGGDEALGEVVEKSAHDYGVPLLFGGYEHLKDKDYNSFFFLQPSRPLQTYHKSKLLVFGEYVPGADRFDFLKKLKQVGNFGRGPGSIVLELKTRNNSKSFRVAPMICYESYFPDFSLQAANQRGQLLLNISDDSWFGPWGAAEDLLALTSFRSIETRLPLLRSTNTGISALITATGEIEHATGVNTKEIMNVYVPITPPIWTLMKAWGDWFGKFALAVGVFGCLIAGLRTKTQT